MLEDHLKKLKKPVGVTSYRELMESRLSAAGMRTPERNSSFTDSEANKIVSPLVSTFQSVKSRNNISVGELSIGKRKSTEMVNNDESQNIEQAKKSKANETILSQKEQEEVSQVLSDLMMDEGDDELLNIGSNCHSNPLSPNLFSGVGVRVIPRPSSDIRSQSQPENNVSLASQRLSLRRSKTLSLPKNCELATNFRFYDKPLSPADENAANRGECQLFEDSNQYAKKIFRTFLQSKSSSVEFGNDLADNSDTDDTVKWIDTST